MKDEKKVLGILAIVFGGIALIGSWVPILNNVSFFIAIISLILGVIALIVNRKKQKSACYCWNLFIYSFNHHCTCDSNNV